jgi:hypothetical protein
MKSVLFISGQSANDALGAAGRAHRQLFEEFGYAFQELDFSTPAAGEALNRALQSGEIELAFSAMGQGADIKVTKEDGSQGNLWETIGVPYLSLKGDSPAYFFDRHVMRSRWHASLYFFPEHLALRKRLPMTPALYGLVPVVPFDQVRPEDMDFRAKESGRLLYLKNGNDPDKLVRSWREAMPAPTFLMLADLAAELAASLTTDVACDIDSVVTACFSQKGWHLGEFLTLRLFFIAQLDDYLRRVKSLLIADAIADFPVIIQGINWEHFDFSRRRATYIHGGDYGSSRKQILESLGIIDMSPNTQRAPHDRTLRALALHTLCLTNEQSFFNEQFSTAADFTYAFDRDAIQKKVADALDNPKRYVELGRANAQHFAKSHRREDLIQFMLDTSSHMRLALGPRPSGLQNFFVWPPAFVESR